MSTSWAILRLLALAGATWFLLASHASVRADPTLTPEVQAQINRAIDKGVKFLRGTQYRNGTWAEEKGAHKVGYSALPALTLLECGVSPKEPAVQWAAYFVRGNSAKLDSTYELALSILLLDRLRDKRDRPLIEKLSLRLMAGQTVTGGWGYRCPVLDVDQHKSWLGYLKMKKVPSAKAPAYWRNLPVFQNRAEAVLEDPKDTAHAPQGGTTDNSKSQVATLALWAAPP